MKYIPHWVYSIHYLQYTVHTMHSPSLPPPLRECPDSQIGCSTYWTSPKAFCVYGWPRLSAFQQDRPIILPSLSLCLFPLLSLSLPPSSSPLQGQLGRNKFISALLFLLFHFRRVPCASLNSWCFSRCKVQCIYIYNLTQACRDRKAVAMYW